MLSIQYGSAIKTIPLSPFLSSASIEQSLESRFSIKGKGVIGFRYLDTNDVYVLDDENERERFLKELSTNSSPLLPVFHSRPFFFLLF